MGNCHRQHLTESTIDGKVFEAIHSGVYRRLVSIVDFYKPTIGIQALDCLRTKYKKMTTNPLGLCLLLGSTRMFKLLLDSGSDPIEMDNLFKLSHFNPIEFLCNEGYHEILKLYFPISYNSADSISNTSVRSYSVAFSCTFLTDFFAYPIHIACHKGHLEIISFFYDFFKSSPTIPKEYNIESLEDSTGENCALIACRRGNYELVKFLHTKCKANFGILNDYKENAVIVTIAGMNKQPNYNFVTILMYLVDEVKIDVTYMYEDALALTRCRPIQNYLRAKLKKMGIDVPVNDEDQVSFDYVNPETQDEKKPPVERIFSETFLNKVKPDDLRSGPSSIYASGLFTEYKDSESLMILTNE